MVRGTVGRNSQAAAGQAACEAERGAGTAGRQAQGHTEAGLSNVPAPHRYKCTPKGQRKHPADRNVRVSELGPR